MTTSKTAAAHAAVTARTAYAPSKTAAAAAAAAAAAKSTTKSTTQAAATLPPATNVATATTNVATAATAATTAAKNTNYWVIYKCDSLQAPALFTDWDDCSFYVDASENDGDIRYQRFDNLVDATNYLETGTESQGKGSTMPQTLTHPGPGPAPAPMAPMNDRKRPALALPTNNSPHEESSNKRSRTRGVQEYVTVPLLAAREDLVAGGCGHSCSRSRSRSRSRTVQPPYSNGGPLSPTAAEVQARWNAVSSVSGHSANPSPPPPPAVAAVPLEESTSPHHQGRDAPTPTSTSTPHTPDEQEFWKKTKWGQHFQEMVAYEKDFGTFRVSRKMCVTSGSPYSSALEQWVSHQVTRMAKYHQDAVEQQQQQQQQQQPQDPSSPPPLGLVKGFQIAKLVEIGFYQQVRSYNLVDIFADYTIPTKKLNRDEDENNNNNNNNEEEEEVEGVTTNADTKDDENDNAASVNAAIADITNDSGETTTDSTGTGGSGTAAASPAAATATEADTAPIENDAILELESQEFSRARTDKALEWDKRFALLEQYKILYGNVNVEVKKCKRTQFATLPDWLVQQRFRVKQLIQRSKVAPNAQVLAQTAWEVRRLKKIGFKLKTPSIEERWQKFHDQMVAYKGEHGHCIVSTRDKPQLYHWFNRNRERMLKLKEDPTADIGLDDDQIQSLKDLDFAVEPTTALRWDEMLEQLKEYKAEHGNIDIKSQRPATKLSNWTVTQRRHFKLMKGGKKSPMDGERMRKLTELGFVFHHVERMTFDERASQWLDYRTKNGKDPSPEDQGVGVWVLRIRRKRRKFLNGEKTNVTQEQIDRLTAWGFRWDTGFKAIDQSQSAPPKPWEERFQELVRFKEEHGHANVPQKMRGLGAWVHTQRRLYTRLKKGSRNANSLTAERIKGLQNIGFKWVTRKRPTKPGQKKDTLQTMLDSDEGDLDGDDESSDDEMARSPSPAKARKGGRVGSPEKELDSSRYAPWDHYR